MIYQPKDLDAAGSFLRYLFPIYSNAAVTLAVDVEPLMYLFCILPLPLLTLFNRVITHLLSELRPIIIAGLLVVEIYVFPIDLKYSAIAAENCTPIPTP